MTGFLTVYWQNKILGLALNATAYSFPATIYIGLCTGVNQTTGAVTGEPTIGTNAYARVSVTTSGTSVLGAPSSGSVVNTGAITFPTATSTGWTGTLTTWFASDASSAGNTLMFGTLTSSLTVGVNQAPTIPVSSMTLNGSGW